LEERDWDLEASPVVALPDLDLPLTLPDMLIVEWAGGERWAVVVVVG
jgi:hypothetical protein